MRKDITIVAEPRSSRGKNEARRLRVAGQAPGVLYGAGGDAVAVAISPKEVNKILRSNTGHNTIFNLTVTGGETVPVMVVDWQHDPVKENLLHVDLKRIDLTLRLRVKVPVHTTGEPKGVKLQGGLQELITREVEIECLPDDIPEQFILDATELSIGDSLRAHQVPMTGSMKLLSNPDAVIAHVVSLKVEEVAVVDAAVVAPVAAEPELAKTKGKKEEEAAPPADDKKKKK
jgi:large subunit ribosomal protein L25